MEWLIASHLEGYRCLYSVTEVSRMTTDTHPRRLGMYSLDLLDDSGHSQFLGWLLVVMHFESDIEVEEVSRYK